jgi:hypothetical protein
MTDFDARSNARDFSRKDAKEKEDEIRLSPEWRHWSRKERIFRLREGCFSFRKALASICRIRSLVTENCCPTSSSV